MVDWKDIVGNVLLFFLVFGMSATVDMSSLKAQLKNGKAIATGIFLQFALMPVLGFMMVRLLDLNDTLGITLLVVTSSPGGSYSNWYVLLQFVVSTVLSVHLHAILVGGAPCLMLT
jgi:predicted Na+-dependent transporter